MFDIIFAGLNDEPPPVEFVEKLLKQLPDYIGGLCVFGRKVEGTFTHKELLDNINKEALEKVFNGYGAYALHQFKPAVANFIERCGNDVISLDECTSAWYLFMWSKIQ